MYIFFYFKVPNEWVQPLREHITEADGFRLYSRSLELRFRLHKTIFGENNSRVKLKCVAHIREVPKAIKESVATIHVPSMDELTNQKLITWRSSTGKSTYTYTNKKKKKENKFENKFLFLIPRFRLLFFLYFFTFLFFFLLQNTIQVTRKKEKKEIVLL